MNTATLGLTAGALARELESWPRRQVKLTELQALLIAAEPALEHAPERRARLADVLGELVQVGAVQLPSERSYDHSAKPALPRFVRLDRAPAAPRRRSGAEVAWRPELAWAAELSLDTQTLSDLRAINAFLRDGGSERAIVPLRERSLQLFGDEKRLEALISSQVFREGRLSLDVVRCRAVHPPFVFQPVGPGPDALVIENHHTFASLADVLPADGSVGTLVYGAGGHFKGSVTYLADLPAQPRRVIYFGDLDVDGLDIPAYANGIAAAAALPPIEPATELYRLLLEHGLPAATAPVSAHRARELCAWLPRELRGASVTLLTRGERLAQEAVGMELLAQYPAIMGDPASRAEQ
jgi:hypothetical protein